MSLPGFRASLGFTTSYLGLVVLIPLAALYLQAVVKSPESLVAALTEPRVLAAYRLSLLASLAAAAWNAVMGLLVAWVLVRYEFFGKRVVDALVDLPFAMPTAVSGIALTALYAPSGVFGKALAAIGIKAAYAPLGVALALSFIGLPFVVRTVQPALEDLARDVEDAAASLGATRWQTFARVVFPALRPALLTGFALAFARGLGEYGSVVFIAGNLPLQTEIAPLLIVYKLEQHDVAGACAIAVVTLTASFLLLAALNGAYRLLTREA